MVIPIGEEVRSARSSAFENSIVGRVVLDDAYTPALKVAGDKEGHEVTLVTSRFVPLLRGRKGYGVRFRNRLIRRELRRKTWLSQAFHDR